MGRNSSSNNTNAKGQSHHVTGLLNFHFATPHPSQEQQNHYQQQSRSNPRYHDNYHNNYQRGGSGGGRGRGRGRRRNNNNNQQQMKQHHQSASERRQRTSQMFYLHSSREHAFIITRRTNTSALSNNLIQQQSAYSFNGPDSPVLWESVRMVKQLVPSLNSNKVCAGHTTTGTDTAVTTCPICLDTYTCPRITKCGHSFCLSCILHHFQSYAANNPYQHVKCPCCGVPLLVDDLRPVCMESTDPLPVANRSFSFIKLHRSKECSAPYLPYPDQSKHSNPHMVPCTTDDDSKFCRFNYVDPILHQTHLTQNQKELEQNIATIKTFISTNSSRMGHYRGGGRGGRGRGGRRELISAATTAAMSAANSELTFLTMALEIVMKEQHAAQSELDEELALQERYASPNAGMYQNQSSTLICDVVRRMDEIQIKDDSISNIEGWKEDEIHQSIEQQHQSNNTMVEETTTIPVSSSTTIPSSPSQTSRRYRGDSIGSHLSIESSSSSVSCPSTSTATSLCNETSTQPTNKRGSKRQQQRSSVPKLKGGMMYLDENSVPFYQSEDGQLIFMNGFNMACLLTDYSKTIPSTNSSIDEESISSEQRQQQQPNRENPSSSSSVASRSPLPDRIKGNVLEVETIHLTPDVRKRMAFLSHIPLYTDLTFVELDLNHILSDSTKKRFKSDFIKRKKKRQSKVQADKRADREAKQREEDRIQCLKARIQRIDPNDEFFHAIPSSSLSQQSATAGGSLLATGDEFGPAIGNNNGSGDGNNDNTATGNNNTTTRQEGRGSVSSGGVLQQQTAASNVSFSQACRQAGGGFVNPSLAEAFPALGASPSTMTSSTSTAKKVNTTWGKGTVVSSTNPSGGGGANPENVPSRGGKKKKGKKVVLFSTGGQRGPAL